MSLTNTLKLNIQNVETNDVKPQSGGALELVLGVSFPITFLYVSHAIWKRQESRIGSRLQCGHPPMTIVICYHDGDK